MVALEELGVTPLFHVVDNEVRASGFDHAWFENDHDPVAALLDIPFTSVGSSSPCATSSSMASSPATAAWRSAFSSSARAGSPRAWRSSIGATTAA